MEQKLGSLKSTAFPNILTEERVYICLSRLLQDIYLFVDKGIEYFLSYIA